MGANRNHPLLMSSLHHHEILDDGRSGMGETIGWSGDSPGDRIRYTGYSSGWKGENILKRNSPVPFDTATMEGNHAVWWNSSGHRDLLMDPVYHAFGHHAMNDLQGPNPRHWATETFAEPPSPKTHLLGVLYADSDGNGDWTPRHADDPLREGLGGVPIHVLYSGKVVATGETMDNGAFTINIQSGVFDIVFGYDLQRTNVRLANENLDLGDVTAIPQPGDANRDLLFNQHDLVRVLKGGKYLSGQTATWAEGDWTHDGLFDQADIIAAAQTERYLKVFEPPPLDTEGALLVQDFEDTFGFTTRGNARYWGVAPLSGTGAYPSRFREGASQSGNIFYGVNGWDSTATMTIGVPDLTGYTDLQLTMALAAPGGTRWESTHRDSLIISGSTGTIDSFLPKSRGAPLTSQLHSRDLRLDFQDFNYSIDSNLESLTFQFASTGDDEVIGIDSVRITGKPQAREPITIPEPTTIAIAVLGLPGTVAFGWWRRRRMA
jgi:hypothetical protein